MDTIERVNLDAMDSRQRVEIVKNSIPHRKLPYSEENETAFLASAFIAPEAVRRIAHELGLVPEWFHIPAHRALWNAFAELQDGSKGFDVFLLMTKLREAKKLDEVGGPSFVTSLFTYLPTAANARHYAEHIEDAYTRREIIQRCTATAESAYNGQGEASAIMERFEIEASSLAMQRYRPSAGAVKDAVMSILGKVANGYTEDDFGISTGYTSLDAIVRGMKKKHMWVIAGESSAGKTSFALNLIYNVCVKKGHQSEIFTLETDREELVEVLIQIGSGVNVDDVAKGRCSEGEMRLFNQAAEAVSKAPLIIHDDADMSVQQIRSILRRSKPRFALLDYAQLLRGGGKKYENATQELVEISRGTKKMAAELQLTALLLSQLNDDGKMAGSRTLLKDADQTFIVADPTNGPETEKLVRVVKQRRGKKTVIPFHWVGKAQQFFQRSLSGD